MLMNKRIMIVDDSTSLRQMVVFTLEGARYDAVEAADGTEGIEKLAGNSIDLIITDLNMPGMDGMTFIKEVRNMPAYRYVPILVLTTESDTLKREESRAAGATGWIVKPFKPDKLLGVVEKLLS